MISSRRKKGGTSSPERRWTLKYPRGKKEDTKKEKKTKEHEKKDDLGIDPHDLSVVAMKASLRARAMQSLFAIDDAMRMNYDALKALVANSVRPVIVVQNDLQGGTYTLLEHDRRTTVQPVPPVFQMVKSVSHAPLGIYSIIAPYLGADPTDAWRRPAEDFAVLLSNAERLVAYADLPADAQKACEAIITSSLKFIASIVKKETVTVDDFKDYTGPLEKAIAENLTIAGDLQVKSIRGLLERWKERLKGAWKDLYAVVLVIWTTELNNQHYLILKSEMDPSRVDDHLIVLGTATLTDDTVDVALENLGQIVQDNIAAALVFSNPDELDTDLGISLKGPEDLLSWAVKKALKRKQRAYAMADGNSQQLRTSCPHVHVKT
jgi:hypothetical protein